MVVAPATVSAAAQAPVPVVRAGDLQFPRVLGEAPAHVGVLALRLVRPEVFVLRLHVVERRQMATQASPPTLVVLLFGLRAQLRSVACASHRRATTPRRRRRRTGRSSRPGRRPAPAARRATPPSLSSATPQSLDQVALRVCLDARPCARRHLAAVQLGVGEGQADGVLVRPKIRAKHGHRSGSRSRPLRSWRPAASPSRTRTARHGDDGAPALRQVGDAHVRRNST